MSDMTGTEEATKNRRISRFMQEGLPRADADDLAMQLLRRDRHGEFDERRVCFECTNLSNRGCLKILDKYSRPIMPLRFILQRCKDFNLRGSK